MNPDIVHRILEKHNSGHGNLIAILDEIQTKFSYLPSDALEIVAEKLDKSLVDIYGVATFYKSFSLNPRGKHLVSVCMGTACHVRTAPIIVEEFERQLKISAGETTQDKEFTLETVNCLGACALGPIVMADGQYYSKVNTGKIKSILRKIQKGAEDVEVKVDDRIFSLDVSCPRCNHRLLDHQHLIDNYPSIRVTITFERLHGWIRMSSLYGSYNIESEYEIPKETIVNFFCPHCHSELLSSTICPSCDASMIPLIVRGGGMVEICSRYGCREHFLDLNGVNF